MMLSTVYNGPVRSGGASIASVAAMVSTLPPLNATQAAAAQLNLDIFIDTSVIPLFLLESYLFGALSISLLLGLYTLWGLRGYRDYAKIFTFGAIVFYGGFATHWALGLRQMGLLMSGLAINWSELLDTNDMSGDLSSRTYLYRVDGQVNILLATNYDLPSIAETVLLGVSSTLFLIALNAFQRSRTQFNTRSAVIPCCACLMFIIAVVHWCIEIYLLGTQVCFAYSGVLNTSACPSFWQSDFTSTIPLTLLSLLSLNVLLSDAVVLWRVYTAWDRRRWVLVLCCILSLCTLTLTIAYMANVNIDSLVLATGSVVIADLPNPGFDGSKLGIAILSSSLFSNICATVLVAFKAWRYRKEIGNRLQNISTRRTMVERVFALLLESGLVYSFIWASYIISNTTHILDSSIPGIPRSWERIASASAIFNSAMVQITSIYPTILVVLITFGRIQHQEQFTPDTTIIHARQPSRRQVVITVDIDVELSATEASAGDSMVPHTCGVPKSNKFERYTATSTTKKSERCYLVG